MKTISRKIEKSLLYSLKKAPVVFLNGARQAGKSTLVQKLSEKKFPAHYISLDNLTQLSSAQKAPYEFLNSKQALIIDEVQMAPELFRPLKEKVDQLRLKNKKKSLGRFLLTGSANIMALPKLSDALVGRMSVKSLYPFSVSEVLNTKEDFLKRLFHKDFQSIKNSKLKLEECISLATFPDISNTNIKEYSEWFNSYLMTILQRDVKMLSQLKKINLLPHLLQVLATRAGSLVNEADISREVGLNAVSGKEYRNILQAMFLTFTIPPWHKNKKKRLVKSSKIYLTDTLLLCYLQGWNLGSLRKKQAHFYGHAIENFVATELIKLISFSELPVKLMHFRTSDNKEVDFILELSNGKLAAIEVKAGDSLTEKSFKALLSFKELNLKNFVCGIVLYNGRQLVPFGKDLFAVPFSALWS